MKRAFSLIELLVVIAIILILAVLALPSVSSIGRASSLNRATQTVTGMLDLARQTAVSQNRSVEVRFYKLPEDGQPSATPSDYSGMQIFLVDYDSTNAIDKPVKFPVPFVIFTNVLTSSLMNGTNCPEQASIAGVTVPPVGSNYKYRSFRFKSDGGMDLSLSNSWFFTIAAKTDPIATNNLPANYAKIEIEPMTGRINVTRP